MHILMSNDDGVTAEGLSCLEKALSKIARVTVIAPDQNRSGVSSGISLETPLRVRKTIMGYYQLNGTPADCVKLALSGFLDEEPDMVVSGINAGANLGDDVWYSGTVGAAMEGRYLKLPSIAVSSIGEHGSDMHYETAASVVVDLVQKLQQQPMEPGLILNVNVPSVPLVQLNGVKICRQGHRYFSEPLQATVDGRNEPIYWTGRVGRVRDGGEGTDFHAIHEGYASVTPMHVDLTEHRRISALQDWLAKE